MLRNVGCALARLSRVNPATLHSYSVTRFQTVSGSKLLHSTAIAACEPKDSKPSGELELQKDNLFSKVYKKVYGGGLPKTKLKAAGYILETCCSQQIDLRAFFRELEMPDTFYSWFLVTELHIWVVGVRWNAACSVKRLRGMFNNTFNNCVG